VSDTNEDLAATFAELAGLDRTLHEPARLAIASALSACACADFLYLQRLTGLSKGNLSAHLTKLESAGYVHIEKSFVGKRTQTTAALTDSGAEAIARYWDQMETIATRTRQWRSAL
jgi:DNA-binding MarR family transcriptional regulator